jgi:hypothetical protein
MPLRWPVRHPIKDLFVQIPQGAERDYGHLTELRARSLDRCTCRDMTPEEHALLRALVTARNADRSAPAADH